MFRRRKSRYRECASVARLKAWRYRPKIGSASLSGERHLFEASLQRFRVRRPENAALRDDAGDEMVGRDVERGIPDVRAVGRELQSADVRHFARVPFFDRNV